MADDKTLSQRAVQSQRMPVNSWLPGPPSFAPQSYPEGEEVVQQIVAQGHDEQFNRLTSRYRQAVKENQQLRSNLVVLAEGKAQFFQRIDRQAQEHATIVKELTALNLKLNEDNVRLQKENGVLSSLVDKLTVGMAEMKRELTDMRVLLKHHVDMFDTLIIGQLGVNFKDKIYCYVYDATSIEQFEGWTPDWRTFMQDLDASPEMQQKFNDLKKRVGSLPPNIGVILNSILTQRLPAAYPYNGPGHPVSESDIVSAILKQPHIQHRSLLQILHVVKTLAEDKQYLV